jgi:ATP-dependent Lhr-like helicase
MSATVSDPSRLAQVYLGTSAGVAQLAGQREVQAQAIVASGDDRDRAHAAMEALDAFDDVRKILVFVNSRKQVDVGAGHFQHGRFSAVPVYGHHGNLSKWQREDAEARFKSDARAICVATMTLEVGIDIGDVDLVICMDPPFSLSSFLQRIGRGCRRLNGKTRVLCVARNRAGELMFQALIRQAVLGMAAGPLSPFRRSVMVQQALAYLRQVDKHRRTLDQFLNVLASSEKPAIGRDLVTDVLADMVQTGLLASSAAFYEPASAGWEFITSSRIYSNIQSAPYEVSLVDADSGKPVATIAGLGHDPSGVRVAGRSYEVLPGGSPFRQKVRRGGDHADSPEYHARSLPYAFDVGASLAGHLAIPRNRLAVVRIGDNTLVMTWLGRLMNSAIAEGIRRLGRKVVEKSFSLRLPDVEAAEILPLLRRAVELVSQANPLGPMPIERLADLGPHFGELSQDSQRMAREDWLDRDFLRAWGTQIEEVQVFAPDEGRGQDLIELAKV